MQEPKQNKKSHSLELISRPEATTASQENDAAKVQNKSKVAINNLKIIARLYEGIVDSAGFITNLKLALGIIPNHSSDYSLFMVGDPPHEALVRISNHNANAANYVERQMTDKNISIVVKSRRRTGNTFVSNDLVVLEEYVYLEKDLSSVESPFSKIAISLAGFLETGVYLDRAGVARKNISP
jgi:hypothetical protein